MLFRALLMAPAALAAAAAAMSLPTPASVLAAADSANAYYIAHNTMGDCGWTRGTYYAGSLAHFSISKNTTVAALALAWANNHSWICSSDPLNCNSFTCGMACKLTSSNLFTDRRPFLDAALNLRCSLRSPTQTRTCTSWRLPITSCLSPSPWTKRSRLT